MFAASLRRAGGVDTINCDSASIPFSNSSTTEVNGEISIREQAALHLGHQPDDGPATSDELLAYDAVVAVREGDVIGGVTLTSSAAVLGASLNNAGWAVHVWSRLGGDEFLFAACDASDLPSSVLVAATGDEVDVDDNGSADATITDFGVSTVAGPGLWLAEDGRVFANVDLDFGAGDVEAIVGFELPCLIPEIFADGFESGDTSVWSSTSP